MNPNEIIGKNIFKAREEMGVKQETLAKAIGISAAALSHIENGKADITVNRVNEIAIALKKDFYYIMGHPNKVEVHNSPNTWFNNTNAQFTDPNLAASILKLCDKVIELIEKK